MRKLVFIAIIAGLAMTGCTQKESEKKEGSSGRNRQTLWGGCTDANPKLLLNDT